jgi:hypothetical protein
MKGNKMKMLRITTITKLGGVLSAGALCLLAGQYSALADDSRPGVAPPNSHPFGMTYNQWAGRWWQWYLQLPLTNAAGAVHPGIDAGQSLFDVSEHQQGQVWFLAAPLTGLPVERTATIPADKALFFPLLNVEVSSLECQGCPGSSPCNSSPACFCRGTFFGTPLVPVETYIANDAVNLACSIDGTPVANITSFRFHNSEIHFTAPSPWINSCANYTGGVTSGSGGDGGAPGTSVGDGYYIFLNPLSPGVHTLHTSGTYHFADQYFGTFDLPLDMTYILTVQSDNQDEQ